MFTDTETGQKVKPGSLTHSISDMVTAALRAGLALDLMIEDAPDAGFARRYPRAEKYVDWPMLLLLRFRTNT
mgnify:CR=1 FL=1